jgi:hypothetical protein
MLQRIGFAGVFGLLVVASGLGLVTWVSPLIGAGLAVMIFGFGIVVQAVVSRTLAQFGMGGGMLGGDA